MEYTIDFQGSYLSVKLFGVAELRAYSECIKLILDHEYWTAGTSVLLDQTELDTGSLTVEEVRAIAHLCGARRAETGAGSLAMLVDRDLEYGMNRMWSVFVEDQWDVGVGVFRSRDKAVAWLTA